MTGSRGAPLVLACTLVSACAPALPPMPSAQGGGEPAESAEALYARIRTILQEMKAEPSAPRREAMAVEAVRLGQRCDQAAKGSALCDYGLALALGAQARERPATARDGLSLMEKRLLRAAASDPTLDHAGPERVLGLLLARAPGFPMGPGDPESGLKAAETAARRVPDYAPNWLAVAEAADVTGDREKRRKAAQTAVSLAETAARAGVPEAPVWQRDAHKLLHK